MTKFASAGSYADLISKYGPTARLSDGDTVMVKFAAATSGVGRGAGGLFVYDSTDTTTAADNGLTIVDRQGRRWKRYFSGAVSPLWFGTAGDGIADDTSAWLAALATNRTVDGEGKLYAVKDFSRRMAPGDRSHIRNARFVHLDPAGDGDKATKVLEFLCRGGEVVIERSVSIDRNGNKDGSDTALHINQGLRIVGADYAEVGCEVFGNNAGECIKLDRVKRYYLDNPYVHDAFFPWHEEIADDVIEAIVLENCGWGHGFATIARLGRTDRSVAERDAFSRGLVLSGGGPHVLAVNIREVDQGVDVSGPAATGNAISGVIEHCYSVGYKLANAKTKVNVGGLTIRHAGAMGILISGGNPANATLYDRTRDIVVSGVAIYNMGTNRQRRKASGIRVTRETLSEPAASFPKNILITGNMIASDEGSADFAVHDADTLIIAKSDQGISIDLGVRCVLATTGSLPAPLAGATDYHLIPVPGTMRIKLAVSYIDALDGIAITGYSGGSGVHSLTLQSDMDHGIAVETLAPDESAPILVQGNRISGATEKAVVGAGAPDAKVRMAADQALSHATWTTVEIDETAVDKLSLLDAANGTFVAPWSGKWRLDAVVAFAANAAGQRIVKVQSDPTGTGTSFVNRTPYIYGAPSAAVTTSLAITMTDWLAKGTLVRVQAYQDSGARLMLLRSFSAFDFQLEHGFMGTV